MYRFASPVVLLALLSLAFAPAPFPRPAKPAPEPPATEVIVEAKGNLDDVEVTFGRRKVSIEPGEGWQKDLTDWLRKFREAHQAPQRLTLRCNHEEMSPG